MPVSLLPLQLRQLRFHLRNQRLQLLLTFPARVCIDIPCMLFAVDPCRGVAALKQVVVDLADTAGVTIKLIRYFELAISTIYAFLISVEFMELVQSRDYKTETAVVECKHSTELNRILLFYTIKKNKMEQAGAYYRRLLGIQ